MIFSAEKWNNGKEIAAYVPVSSSLSFDKMQSSLESASDLFLRPLLGADMMDDLDAIYNKPTFSRSDGEGRLLECAQRVVANLSFWYNFDSLQLRITDQGFQRQGSEDWQQAYKYQEDHLREGFKTKGFNAIDRLLDYLELQIVMFPHYEQSPAHVVRSTSLVKDTEDVQYWLNIGSSRLMFLRFSAEFPTVTEDVLKPELGAVLYGCLQTWLSDPSSYPYEVPFEEFRKKCVRVVVTATAVRLLKRTGSLTDRGLYFDAVTAANTENVTHYSGSDGQIGSRLESYEADLRRALAGLRAFVSDNYSDITGTKASHVVRDNEGHAGFFAM